MAATNHALIVPPPSPAAVAATNNIRAIKPPVEIPNDWAWLWWTLAAVALIAAGVWLWIWWKRKHARPVAVVVVPPHMRAKQKLAEALALIHDPRLFCIAVSDALRWYLEERFRLHAPERTTDEFLVELQSSNALLAGQKSGLGEFLQNCDLVKFARFEPTEAALRELHEAALRLVDETQYEPPAPASVGNVPPPDAVTHDAPRATP